MERRPSQKSVSPSTRDPPRKPSFHCDKSTPTATYYTPIKQRPYSPISTPDSLNRRILSRQFTYSEAKPVSQGSIRGVDLLLEAYRRTKNQGNSPSNPDKAQGGLTGTEKELGYAEKALSTACAGITVKALNMLRGHTLPSIEMEKVFFAFLTLFAEVDSSIEVGSNCRVMASRVWPSVLSYLQNPGQVVQTARKFPKFTQSHKISKAAIIRASESISNIAEDHLRNSLRGDVGTLVFTYVKSAIVYYTAWTRSHTGDKHTPVQRTGKKSVSPLRHNSSFIVSLSSLTPVDTESDQATEGDTGVSLGAAGGHVKGAPSFGSEEFEAQQPVEREKERKAGARSPLGERRETRNQEKLSRSKSQDDVRRSLSVLEMTLDWELDSAYRSYLTSKITSSEGHSQVFLHRDSILAQFPSYLSSVPALEPHLHSEVAQTRIAAFVDRLKSESEYNQKLQSVLRPGRRHCRDN